MGLVGGGKKLECGKEVLRGGTIHLQLPSTFHPLFLPYSFAFFLTFLAWEMTGGGGIKGRTRGLENRGGGGGGRWIFRWGDIKTEVTFLITRERA